MRALLTGFEPFGGDRLNASWEAVRRVDPARLPGIDLVTLQLPCVFGRSADVLAEAVERLRPDLLVAVGQANGRAGISLERVAINIDDAREPDNAGCCPADAPILEDGPPAYFSTLPLKALLGALREAGHPVDISNSAGTYVCNHLFYRARHLAETRHPDMRVGFVHVARMPEQEPAGERPTLEAVRAASAIEAIIAAMRPRL